MKYLEKIELRFVVILCASLGLAPFLPPHIWEKLQMLFAGELTKPIDIFDFFFHGLPWVLLIAKLMTLRGKSAT
ncbi:MAG TPA: RND transporter [Paracoccaceae bacterium]|nr:RND transporter [Paracoccaceae bacterium]